MIECMKLKNRDEWLNKRATFIGGSDAACIVGLNPWRSNVELWEIKTGRKKAEDISQNELVAYGTKAEKPLRDIFALDYPELAVDYIENNIWFNSRYPWAHASIDGLLTDTEGRRGILEIKTSNIINAASGEKWKGRIPDNYYIQILHYMAVLDADFAILKAQLKYKHDDGDIMHITRHYRIERESVEDDIIILMEAEERFAEDLKRDTPPALILPEV